VWGGRPRPPILTWILLESLTLLRALKEIFIKGNPSIKFRFGQESKLRTNQKEVKFTIKKKSKSESKAAGEGARPTLGLSCRNRRR
jgi:hypothetical protein